MNSWERLNEISLLDKIDSYSKLNSEDITDKDYAHAQNVFKRLKVKNLSDYHDLYVQSDILLLADLLKTLETNVLKYMSLILFIFCLLLD